MGDVKSFPGLAAPAGHIPVQQELIDRLESLLEDARAGRLVALAYAGVGQHEMIRSSWCGEVSRHFLGYALTKLQIEYFKSCSDDG